MNNNDLKYILNEKNKPITVEYIEGLLARYGIKVKVKNLELFQEAMIHISYLVRDEKFYSTNKTKPYQIQSNDIEPLDDLSKAMPLQKQSGDELEYLGDSVDHNIIAEYIFIRYRTNGEGFMTKLRTKIENSDSLYVLAKIVGLNEYVVISRYVEKNGGRETNKNILEDCFEAFMGALYLNFGYDICKQFLVMLIEKEMDMAQLLYQETNFKERLLQYFHLRKWADPKYDCMDVSGQPNRRMYTMYVKCKKDANDEGTIVGIAQSSSKPLGEQMAAKASLQHFGVINDDDDIDDEIEEISSDEEDSIKDSDSLSDYKSDEEEENDLKCKKCKKDFKTKQGLDKHVVKCK